MKQRTNRKKRRIIKRTMKKQRGGSDMNAILLGLLDERYVTLPSTRCIKDNKLTTLFLKSVTALDLFTIIGKSLYKFPFIEYFLSAGLLSSST